MSQSENTSENPFLQPPSDIAGEITDFLQHRPARVPVMNLDDYAALEAVHSNVLGEFPGTLPHKVQRDNSGWQKSLPLRPENWGEDTFRVTLEQGAPRCWELLGVSGLRFGFQGNGTGGKPFETRLEVINVRKEVVALVWDDVARFPGGKVPYYRYSPKQEMAQYLLDLLNHPLVVSETQEERQRRNGNRLTRLLRLG